MYVPDHEVEFLYSRFLLSDGVSIDTRTLQSGDIFFALSGTRQDGHLFIEAAFAKGASYAVVDQSDYAKQKRCIYVKDVLSALQALACLHRNRYKRTLIGITGSCGKTTTRSLITSILKRKYIVTSSEKSYNNHIGVPLSLLSIIPQTEIAVLELGISQPGEMNLLSELAQPTHGLITYIGAAHLEGLSDRAGVLREKRKLFDFIKKTSGTFFRNTSLKELDVLASEDAAQLSFPNAEDRYPLRLVSASPVLKFQLPSGLEGEVSLFGAHHFHNVSAAVAVAQHFGVADTDIVEALASWRPMTQRCEWIQHRGRSILMDSYNANPDSMRAALQSFAAFSKGPKALILGDMLELGDASAEAHRRLGQEIAATQDWALVLLCGTEIEAACEALPQAHYFSNKQDLEAYLTRHSIPKEYLILIKGSRSLALEDTLNVL